MEQPAQGPRRVLIYRLGSLGDFVVALPALRLIARVFPDARRCLLTNLPVDSRAPSARSILEHTGLVHEYLEYPIRLRDPVRIRGLAARIRAFGADVTIHLAVPRGLWRSWRDAAFFRACGIRRQIGVPFRRDLLEYRWRDADRRYEHEAERLARSLAALGDAALGRRESWDLQLTTEEKARASERLREAGAGPPYLACSIGTKFETNDWGTENWRQTLRRIGESFPALALVLVGASADAASSEIVASAWPSRHANLCGALAPRESAALLGRAVAYLGHDSGPIHLAAAMGVTCVGVYSARHVPGPWFPYGGGHRVIYHRTECYGCNLAVCTKFGKKCITSIEVNEVVEAARGILGTPVEKSRTQ